MSRRGGLALKDPAVGVYDEDDGLGLRVDHPLKDDEEPKAAGHEGADDIPISGRQPDWTYEV